MVRETEAGVKEIIERTHNVKSIRLEIKDADFKAGQFAMVMLRGNSRLKRYLSISSSPTEKGYIEFTKKLTKSDFSEELNTMQAGDRVKIQYPFGNFTLRDAGDKIAFLSGGIGITPIRSLCKYAVDARPGIDIVLLYGNQSLGDIVFKQDFDEMEKIHPKLRVVHVLCEPSPGLEYKTGLINKDMIAKEIPDYKERKFYICGPPVMVEAMKEILVEELRITQERIITENFQGY